MESLRKPVFYVQGSSSRFSEEAHNRVVSCNVLGFAYNVLDRNTDI